MDVPQKIICEGCGNILFKDIKLRPPQELIHELNGKCPYCDKELIFNSDKLEIKIV
jgi:hypothetical protein